ncbi:MAG: outer membrane protein transport protein [Phascolarctobacterium sp.]|nr:outer membrane protein transport protein [Phascolarctobacterium sp.]
MKKHLLALSAAAVLLAPQAVGAEGFALNEWSAEGMAMGGARMFAENDAANLAYNPASMTKVKGEAFKVSATYLSPHGKYKTYGKNTNVPNTEAATAGTCPMVPSENEGFQESGHNRVHPGWVPGSYYVRQINDKEWVGMGIWSRFGMVSQFEAGSLPGTNSTSAKLNGLSLGVNYAKKMDKKWTASLGAEVNYVGLQVDKSPLLATIGTRDVFGHVHVEGESYALGWNAAANYTFDDKNEIGVVYRSKVKHSMEADYDAAMGSYGNPVGDAYGVVTLPESVMIGYNHKFNDKTRVELNGTWTRWSRYGALNMYMDGGMGAIMQQLQGTPGSFSEKNWEDGWRYAIGIEHKLSDKYSLLGGIAYDESAIPEYPEIGADFMVPTGRRITYTIGGQYHDKDQTLALAIGWMDVGDLDIAGQHDAYDHAEMYDSYTKMVSISYQRNF